MVVWHDLDSFYIVSFDSISIDLPECYHIFFYEIQRLHSGRSSGLYNKLADFHSVCISYSLRNSRNNTLTKRQLFVAIRNSYGSVCSRVCIGFCVWVNVSGKNQTVKENWDNERKTETETKKIFITNFGEFSVRSLHNPTECENFTSGSHIRLLNHFNWLAFIIKKNHLHLFSKRNCEQIEWINIVCFFPIRISWMTRPSNYEWL